MPLWSRQLTKLGKLVYPWKVHLRSNLSRELLPGQYNRIWRALEIKCVSLCVCLSDVALELCLAPHELKKLCTCKNAALTHLAVNSPAKCMHSSQQKATQCTWKWVWHTHRVQKMCHNRRQFSAHEYWCDTHRGCKRCAATCARLKHAFRPLPCSLISFTIPSLIALATPSPAHW